MATELHNDNFNQAVLGEDIDNLESPLIPTVEKVGNKKAWHFTAVSGGSANLEGGGKVSVGTTAVEATFTGTTQSIIITADTANTGTLYVGKSNVASDGSNAITFLTAGEHLTIDYNDASNAVYVVASGASQNFWKGAIV